MNFFDYDLTRSATPPTQAAGRTGQAETSLNEEVTQVVGQLGKLWGGFRKQSVNAFEAARKDLGSVVAQAQKELSNLASEPGPSSQPSATQTDSERSARSDDEVDPAGSTVASSFSDVDKDETQEASSSSAVATPATTASTAPAPATATTPSPFQSLLLKVQSTLPPNISTALESSLPDSLKGADGHLHVDFTQLKGTLSAEFQRVQGVTRAQAEEYVHKSESLLKEAGEFLKDAVKVVPPEEGDVANASVMWDGSDVWVLPTNNKADASAAGKGKGKRKENELLSRARAAGTRAETLLRQLKRDQELLRTNPAENQQTAATYELFVKNDVESKEGGISSAFWSDKIKANLNDESGEGDALKSTKDALVPAILDEETFWTRFFFRVHQIERDEEKRKELLAGAPETDEVFSWEDEEDEDSVTPPAPRQESPDPASDSISVKTLDTLHPHQVPSDVALADSKSYPSSLVTTPSNTSPRESEDSYDVVSSGSRGSVGASDRKKREDDDEDNDSDWE